MRDRGFNDQPDALAPGFLSDNNPRNTDSCADVRRRSAHTDNPRSVLTGIPGTMQWLTQRGQLPSAGKSADSSAALAVARSATYHHWRVALECMAKSTYLRPGGYRRQFSSSSRSADQYICLFSAACLFAGEDQR